MDNKKLNNSIEKILSDGKAENIISISLKGKSSIADYMIIASGSSTRHVSALASQVATKHHSMTIAIDDIRIAAEAQVSTLAS